MTADLAGYLPPVSLPSRGAWIEIRRAPLYRKAVWVAPLAGSVDRNLHGVKGGGAPAVVAPLAGSVDRNEEPLPSTPRACGRSPRGERG